MKAVDRDRALAGWLLKVVSDWDNNRPRSQQVTLGPSALGGCREYIRATVEGDPGLPESGFRAPAFMGTAIGEMLEAIFTEVVAAITQLEIVTQLPRTGITVAGSSDAIIPPTLLEVEDTGLRELVAGGLLLDFKTKDRLATIEREGASLENLVQVAAYLVGAVQMGILPPTASAALVYVDRSGNDKRFSTVTMDYEEALRWVDLAEDRLMDVQEVIARGSIEEDRWALRDKSPSWCFAVQCFTGDTEVVTRVGIQPIASLAGTSPELLVPYRINTGLSGAGVFQPAPVRSYGFAPVRTITLKRGRSRKTVRATPDHQWFVIKRYKSGNSVSKIVATQDLQPGMHLRPIRARRPEDLSVIPFAQAQGFVYGDGSDHAVSFHPNSADKIADVLPLFTGIGCKVSKDTRETGTSLRVTQIPQLWKEAPNFRESMSFLLSWLSGYFAADGTVSKSGQVTIHSARRESIELVRSVCALVGVGYGPVQTAVRDVVTPQGSTYKNHTLYSTNIRAIDLPEWFFMQARHRDRWAAADRNRDDARDWVVESVQDLGEQEEVFCAEVDDVEAFALADGLLTHNCEFRENCWGGSEHRPTGKIEHPDDLAAVARYVDARDDEKAAIARKAQANRDLAGVTGITPDGTTVSWTSTGRRDPDGEPALRLDVRVTR